MSFNRQRNDGHRGGYQYGQQMSMGGGNPNIAGNLLANLAPEAQVALANTLLTTILQGQQPQQPNYGMSGPSYPPYPQQQQRDYYDDRQGYRNAPPMKQPRFGGDRRQDDRNRGRGGERKVDNFRQRRDDVRRKDARTKGVRDNNPDRKPLPKKTGDLPKKTPVKKGEKKPDAASETKPSKDAKKEGEENKVEKVETGEKVEESKSTEESAEKIEDAKAEVKGVEKEDDKDGKLEADAASKEDTKEEKDEDDEKVEKKEEKGVDKEEKKKQERANDKTEYAGIPEAYLYCHICEKQVWDGPSFLRHIRGNKHKSLVQRLEQIYDATIQSMRLLSQLDEQRRTLDIDSKFSFGRQKHRPRKTKCNMCDMSFYGSILTHRSNQAHQALKNFIHAKCTVCNEEFRAKIDYDHHLLSSKHIKKVVEESKGEPPEHAKIVSVIMEELQFRPQMRELKVEGGAEPAPALPEDEYDVNIVGPYDVHTPVGQSEIKTISVFFCDRCSKFIERSEKSKQAHIQSEEHIKNVERKNSKKEKQGEEEKLDETMEVVDEVGETAEGEDGEEETQEAGDVDTAEVEELAGEDDQAEGEQVDEPVEENADETEAAAE